MPKNILSSLSCSDIVDSGVAIDYLRLKPTLSPYKVCGKVKVIPVLKNSNWITHKMLSTLSGNEIVLIDPIDCDRAVMGHLMAYYAIYLKRSIAVIVNGMIRDVDKMKYDNLPVWYKDISAFVCTKEPINIVGWQHKLEGSFVVADGDGAAFIDYSKIDELENIVNREKIWYDRMYSGESTFDITCSSSDKVIYSKYNFRG